MIKKYKEFLLLEKINETDFLNDLNKISEDNDVAKFRVKMKGYRKEFAKKVKSLSEYFEGYYTNLANDTSANPEADFKEMQTFLNRTGFTLEIIKKLFDRKISGLLFEDYNQFIRTNNLESINGYIDVYLYFLNEKLQLTEINKVDLGGASRVNIMLDSESDNLDENVLIEWTIKYAYGYHKTPYGKLFIKQLGLTPEQFIKEVFQKIHKSCFESFMMDSIPVDFGDIKEVLEEVKEDGGLIEQNNNTFKIYLEAFWVIISRFLKKKQSYDEFKQLFIDWLENVTKAKVDDDGMIIQFNLIENL